MELESRERSIRRYSQLTSYFSSKIILGSFPLPLFIMYDFGEVFLRLLKNMVRKQPIHNVYIVHEGGIYVRFQYGCVVRC